MARVKLGPIVDDVRGSIKNVVFSVAKRGVNYIKSKPVNPLNPDSGAQANARFRLQSSVQRWFGDLNPGQRQTWEVMANRLEDIAPAFGGGGSFDIVPPVGGLMSGVNAYAGFRARSLVAGLGGSFSDIAPVGEQQPTSPTGVNAVYDTGTNILTVTWTDPTQIDASGVVSIWLVSRQKTFHRQLNAIIALSTETIDLDSAKGALGASIFFGNVEPQNLIIQMQSVNPSGFASPGSQAREVVLSAV